MMRVGHWFDQANTPLGSASGKPSLNMPGAAEIWDWHNQLMATSTDDAILNMDSLGEGGSAQAFNDGIFAFKASWTNDATTVGNDPKKPEVVAIEFPTPPGGKPSTIVIGNILQSVFAKAPHRDLAIDLLETRLPDPAVAGYMADNAGVFIFGLKSLLEQHETYDKLGGFKTEEAKKLVRVTMKALLNGGATCLPGWGKNADRIWIAINEAWSKMWRGRMAKADIQKELDALQKTVEGLLA
jgi:ABC-type glycerol-3-phosphate transport system substrate-binding protein